MFKTSRNFDHSTTWLLNNKIHLRPILLHRRLWATPWFFGRDWRLCTLQASKGLWQCDNSNSIVSCTGSSFILGDWSLEGPFSWHIWMFSHIQLLSQKSCISIRVGELLHSLKPTFCPLKNGGNDHLLILGPEGLFLKGKVCWFQGRYMIRSKSPTCFISVFFSCFLVVGELLAMQVYLMAWSADLRFHILLVPLTARVWTCSDDSLHQFGFAIIALGCEQQWLPGKQNPRTLVTTTKK